MQPTKRHREPLLHIRMLPHNLAVLAMEASMASSMRIDWALTAFMFKRNDTRRATKWVVPMCKALSAALLVWELLRVCS